MSKRSKPSKEKREEERERQKRLAREKKSQHDNLLMRDLTYFAERGILGSETKWSEAGIDSLWQSQSWRNEREFSNLAFDPLASSQAIAQTWDELKFDPEDIKHLFDNDRDNKNFELNAQAIERLITPAFKQDFLQRLDRFRQRLRAKRDWETLARASLIEVMLQASDKVESKVWAECMLIYQTYLEALHEYLRLSEAAEAVMGAARQTLDQAGKSLDDLAPSDLEPATEAMKQAVEKTPGLMDFLNQSVDRLVDEASAALFSGELVLGLFTPEELEQFADRFVSAAIEAGLEANRPLNQMSDKIAKRVAEGIYEASAQMLKDIDTTARRSTLYAAARRGLQELARQKGQTGLYAMSLLPILEDEKTPPGDNDVLIRALLGEARGFTPRPVSEDDWPQPSAGAMD